jgi:hypothetical protein
MSAEGRPTHEPESPRPEAAPAREQDAADLADAFQQTVAQYLIRHRSIVDIVSKLQESTARVQRAVAKAVTVCGCLEIHACKQTVPDPDGMSYAELKRYVQTHVDGRLCDHCRDVIETELGQAFFYAAALCEVLNLKASDILAQEKQRLDTLGVYSLM